MKEHARLPKPPSAEEIADEERADYDRVVDRTASIHGLEGSAGKYFGALLHSPPLAAVLVQFGTHVRRAELRGTYTDAERELMDIVLAVDLGSNAILAVHIPDALAVGVRPEAIEALLGRREQDLSPEERQLVTYAREFVAGEVSDNSYAKLQARFGDRGAVEFTILIGFLLMTIQLWQALGVPEPPYEDIERVLADLRSGAVPLPGRDARIG